MITVLTNTFPHLEYLKHEFFKTDILKKEFKNSVLKNFLLQKNYINKIFGVGKKIKPKKEKDF